MPLRGAASPMTLTVGTLWSAVDAREPPESLPATSPSPSACATGDERVLAGVSKFSSCRSSNEHFIYSETKETDEETTRADTATHEARALPVDGAGALGARVAAPAAYPGRIIVDARAPPDPPLFIRVFPELCPPSTHFFPYLDFGLALPADAPTGQGARAAAEVRLLLREMLRFPRDVLQLRVQGENQED